MTTAKIRGSGMKGIITIDGPAGSGKSTISRLLAKKIQFLYLDTGAMYRAVALAADRAGIDLNDGQGLRGLCRSLDLSFKTDEDPPRLFLGEEDISQAIRSPEMDMAASTVSAVKEVRTAMTDLQRKMAGALNIVAEGRDMGTVVFPEAAYKFFLTASVEERSGRRYRERVDRGESVTRDAVEKELIRRDTQDETRALAPLRPADDAVVVDSTGLGKEQVLERVMACLKEK